MARNRRPPSPSASSSSDASSNGEQENMEVSLPSPSSKKPVKKDSKETPVSIPPPSVESSEEDEDSDADDLGEEDSSPSKRQTQPPPLKPTPKPSDSGSDEADSGDDESDSESEEAPEKPPQPGAADPSIKPKPISSKPMGEPAKVKKPDASPDSGSDESDSGDDESASESEASPEKLAPPGAPDRSIKPISSKPMGEPTKLQKPSTSPARLNESDKKKRKTPEPEAADQKKQLFKRIFSLQDEIVILKGMEDYHAKKGIVPSPSSSHMNEIHAFVQPSLSITINKNQLAEKIRRLKKKFDNAITRAKNGKDLQFRNLDDQTTYEISKGIWGSTADDIDADDGNKTYSEKESQKTAIKEETSITYLKQVVAHLDNGVRSKLAAMAAMESVDATKARVLEEKFKKLRVVDLKHHLQKMELLKESVKLITDALAKS